MDGGWATQYGVGYRVLKAYGFHACVAVIPAAVGTPGYMDYAQLAELYMSGWDMLNHTYSHANLSKLGAKEQREEICRGAQWLSQNGFTRGSDVLVYPFGASAPGLEQTLWQEGVRAVRSLQWMYLASEGGTPEDIEVFSVVSGTAFADVRDAVDRAVRNKATLILIVNKLEPVTDGTQMQVEPAIFKRLAAHLSHNQYRLEVVSVSELLRLREEDVQQKELSAGGP